MQKWQATLGVKFNVLIEVLSAAEIKNRMLSLKEKGIPVTNYGLVLSEFSGILKRSLDALK